MNLPALVDKLITLLLSLIIKGPLDGWKTIIGLAIVLVGLVLTELKVIPGDVDTYFNWVGGTVGAFGIVDKANKMRMEVK